MNGNPLLAKPSDVVGNHTILGNQTHGSTNLQTHYKSA